MSGRGWAGTALKTLAFLAVLALLYFVLRSIGFAGIVGVMRGVSPLAIGAAALLYLAVFLLWSYRWQQFMQPADRKHLAALFPIYMTNVFGNVVTPGARVGGEPLRAYYMSKVFGGEKSAYFGTVLADKLSNGAVFMVFLALSVGFVVLFVPMGLLPKLVLAAALLIGPLAVAIGVVLHRHADARSPLLRRLLGGSYRALRFRFVRRRFPTCEDFQDFALRKLDNVISPIADAAGSPRTLARVAAISVAAWLLFCLAHYVLFANLGADLGFHKVLVIVTISTFFGDVSVSPGGAGFIETAMLALCAAFGVDPGTAAAVTIISRGLFYLWGLGVGGLCVVALALVYDRRP